MTGSVLLLFLIALPFAGSLLAGFLPTNARNTEAWFAGAIAFLGLVAALLAYPTIAGGEVIRYEIEWLPSLGLNFVFRMDGFPWIFAVVVTIIGVLVVIYARYYMSPQDPVPRFFAFLLAFMASMLGVVLSGNLIQLVFFWEMTSIFSFLLIGYWYHLQAARDGARMALTVTAMGGLALLVATGPPPELARGHDTPSSGISDT